MSFFFHGPIYFPVCYQPGAKKSNPHKKRISDYFRDLDLRVFLFTFKKHNSFATVKIVHPILRIIQVSYLEFNFPNLQNKYV